MTDQSVDIVICDTPLAAPAPVFSGTAGGIIDFWGVVRGLEGAENIAGIDYEAHGAMARHQLEILGREAGERFPIQDLILHHRIGFVPMAEPSLFLRVSAGHRGPAFDAARWLIEQLKLRVPIWKHAVSASTHEELCPAPLNQHEGSPALATTGKTEDGDGICGGEVG